MELEYILAKNDITKIQSMRTERSLMQYSSDMIFAL